MELNKIKISNDATLKLRQLKARTGLTPNIICRIGFCLSLNESGLPEADQYQEDGMEFNRYTLTGEYDKLFISLLKERCVEDGLRINGDLKNLFLAHIHRGVFLLYNRLKSVSDISSLYNTFA